MKRTITLLLATTCVSACVTVDTRAPSTPTVSVTNVSTTEGQDLQFVATREGRASKASAFTFTTTPGSASEADYVARSGTGVFDRGQTSNIIRIQTNKDNLLKLLRAWA